MILDLSSLRNAIAQTNDLVRGGYATGLLQAELAEWKAYRRNRGITEARFLLARVTERQASVQ